MFPAYSNGNRTASSDRNFHETSVKQELEQTDCASTSYSHGGIKHEISSAEEEKSITSDDLYTIHPTHSDAISEKYGYQYEDNKYKTFRQREDLQDKRKRDESYRFKAERERREKELRKVELRKDLRIDTRMSYLRNDSDSDSDDALRCSTAIFDLDSDEEHEVHDSEVIQVEVRNAPKISTRMPKRDREKFLTPSHSTKHCDKRLDILCPYKEIKSEYEVNERKEQDENRSRKNKRKRDHKTVKSHQRRSGSSSSSSSSSSDNSGAPYKNRSLRKNRKKKHGSSSSNSQNSSISDSEEERNYKRKKNRKQKKDKKKYSEKSKKRRRRCNSSGSENDAEARARKKLIKKIESGNFTSMDTLKFTQMARGWTFLPKDWSLSRPDTFLANMVRSRLYDGELVLHDHIHKGELAVYVNKMKVILMPSRISSIDIHPLDKLFYGREVLEQVKKPRYLDKLKWSKKPENYFASHTWSVNDDFVKLAHHRLNPYKEGWQQIEDEREKNERPEIYKEKQYMQGGERTTEVYLEEMQLDKEGSIEQKKVYLDAILKKSHTRDPNLEKTWIERIDLEDAIYRRACLKAKEDGQRVPDKKTFNDVKLSVIEAARKSFPTSVDIFHKKIQVLREDSDPGSINTLFVNKATLFAGQPRFWEMWIDMKMSDMKMYNTVDMDMTFKDFFKRMDAILDKKMSVVRQYCSDAELRLAFLRMLYKRMNWWIHSGRISDAIAFTQCMCEHFQMPPEIYEIFRGDDTDKSQVKLSLKEFWESGASRIGDENAIRWPGYNKDRRNHGEPELEAERTEMDKLEKRIISKYFHDDPWYMVWGKLERARERFSWRPIRTLYDENVELLEHEQFRAHTFDALNLVNVSEERVRLIACECVKVLGARLPFEHNQMYQILQSFGGFPNLYHLPPEMGDFVDRFLAELTNLMPSETKPKYFAARVLTKLATLNRASWTPLEKIEKLLTFCISMWKPEDMDSSIAVIVLTIQEAIDLVDVKAARNDKVRLSSYKFHKTTQKVWEQVEKRYGKKSLVHRLENPIEFVSFATLVYAIVKTCPNEKDVLNVLTHVVLKDSLTGWKMGQTIPGYSFIEATEKWKLIVDSTKMWKQIMPIFASGLYSPSVLSHILNMRMLYARGQGSDLKRVIPCIKDLPSDDLCEIYRALIVKEVIILLKIHERQFHNCGLDLHEKCGVDLCSLVGQAAIDYPTDVNILKEYVEMNSKTFLRRLECAKHLKNRHEFAAKINDPAMVGARQTIAVARLYLERVVFENRMEGDDTQGAAGLLHRLISVYREVADIEHDPFVWRLLMRIHADMRSTSKVRDTYVQAIAQCGWSRALHLDMAEADPNSVPEVMAFMAQKDLHVLVMEGEINLMLQEFGKR